MSAIVRMLGGKLLRGDTDVEVQSLCGEGKVIALFFSGHWCPPCLVYAKYLMEWYKKFKIGENGTQLEIVLISEDRNVDAFNAHYAAMPWLALPYADREKKVCI